MRILEKRLRLCAFVSIYIILYILFVKFITRKNQTVHKVSVDIRHRKSLNTLELINDLNNRNASKILQLALIASTTNRFIKGTRIPAILHQSWKSKRLFGSSKMASLAWQRHCPDLIYLLWDDEDVHCFIETLYPEIMHQFVKLPVIMKADLFRYLVVYEFGGIYTDIDTLPLKSIYTWFRPLEMWENQLPLRNWNIGSEFAKISFIAGLEVDVPKSIQVDAWAYPLQLCQWTFAAVPRYTLLWNISKEIIRNTHEKSTKELEELNVINTTGPGVWTRIIYQSWREYGYDPNEFREFGNSPRIINDQLILPVTAFNPGMAWRGIGTMGSRKETHSNSLVKHLYLGSWKSKP